MAEQSDRQKRIMEHLARSSGNFIKPKLDTSERREQIMQHVRLTKG
ncbi:MAG: hypothetical protein PUP93_25855 [Rhizonema sp. NSF051]|nr:hypothetical protein [Rhizonema sp. NSF051]MDF5723454.1 hypothetical protein [Rhizonema sp. PD37]